MVHSNIQDYKMTYVVYNQTLSGPWQANVYRFWTRSLNEASLIIQYISGLQFYL